MILKNFEEIFDIPIAEVVPFVRIALQLDIFWIVKAREHIITSKYIIDAPGVAPQARNL